MNTNSPSLQPGRAQLGSLQHRCAPAGACVYVRACMSVLSINAWVSAWGQQFELTLHVTSAVGEHYILLIWSCPVEAVHSHWLVLIVRQRVYCFRFNTSFAGSLHFYKVWPITESRCSIQHDCKLYLSFPTQILLSDTRIASWVV